MKILFQKKTSFQVTLAAKSATGLKSLIPIMLGALAGATWLLPAAHLVAPVGSLGLVIAITRTQTSHQRFLAALVYYLAGSISILMAVIGYWGGDHVLVGGLAWIGSSIALATPWMLSKDWRGVLLALTLTALPPLGLIGWLSPLTAAGVLFPGMGWAGLLLLLVGVRSICRSRPVGLAILGTMSVSANLAYTPPVSPDGWVGVNTAIKPARGSVLASIRNTQAVISAALMKGQGAKVIVLPEAVVDDWLPGTRRHFEAVVPPGQQWLIGTQTNAHNSVVAVANTSINNKATGPILIDAAALLPGGNWSSGGLRPAWWQSAPVINGKRVWASICVEQVLPWTWLEAMVEGPEVVLAISNQWWVSPASSAVRIQRVSTVAWARLMGVPVVRAVNFESTSNDDY